MRLLPTSGARGFLSRHRRARHSVQRGRAWEDVRYVSCTGYSARLHDQPMTNRIFIGGGSGASVLHAIRIITKRKEPQKWDLLRLSLLSGEWPLRPGQALLGRHVRLLRRLAVAAHAVAVYGRLRGLKIAVAPLRCFGITFLNCFVSRHRHGRVGSRSRVRFRSLSLLRKGLRSGGNNNRGDYQKREGPHEKSPLHDLGVSHLTQSCDEMAKPP